MQRIIYPAMLLGLIVLLSACSVAKRTITGPAPTTVPRVSMSLNVTGKILFIKGGNIWLWDNGNLKEITKGGHDTQPSWSPDGTAFAYVKQDDNHSDIMLANASTGDVRALTNTRTWGSYNGWVLRPSWTPDGKKIAYLSDEGSYDLALWTMNPDGSGRAKVAYTAQYAGGLDSPSYSPDGKQIALAGFRSNVSEVWTYAPTGGKWQQLTKAGDGAYDPRWSPSGEKIAFVVRDNMKHYIWVMDANGENAKQLTADGTARSPVWSYDGQYLAYISGASGNGFEIWIMKVDIANGQVVTSEPKQLTKGLDVDPGAGLSWLK